MPVPGSRGQKVLNPVSATPVVDPRCLNADPDSAFYLHAYPDPGSHISAGPDPDPGQTLPYQKVEFLHEKYTLCR